MTNEEKVKKEIAEIIEQYRLGFFELDVDKLSGIWDLEHDNVIYIAQELVEPIYGHSGIARYYARVAASLGRVTTMTVSDLSVDVLGDVAYAFCTFRFEGEIAGRTHLANGRNTFILHRKKNLWRTIHYHESAPGLHP